MAGLGWFLEYLRRIGFVDVGTDSLFEDVDGHLFDKMLFELQRGNYDYLHGGLGVLNYFLSKNDPKIFSDKIQDAIFLLESIGEQNSETIAWANYDLNSQRIISSEFNLGLAHGNPGILSVLVNAYGSGLREKNDLFKLIGKSTNFILSLADETKSLNPSLFPNIHVPKDTHKKVSRLGWCYGDLGVALSLRNANRILKSERVDDILNKILYNSTKRTSVTENMILDAGLCHGATGIAHIFNVFYKQNKDVELKKASEYWMQISLDHARFKDGLAGYKSFVGNGYGYVADPGFLTGISGMGLCYMSFLNGNSSWDGSLLINS